MIVVEAKVPLKQRNSWKRSACLKNEFKGDANVNKTCLNSDENQNKNSNRQFQENNQDKLEKLAQLNREL